MLQIGASFQDGTHGHQENDWHLTSLKTDI